ncbi:MAG: protein kinase [Gemmatimonadales bacterium]
MIAGSLTNASVGPYRLVDFLGAGGMGEVYRGIHESLGRVVAVKVLSTTGSAARLEQRFRNEAQLQSGLTHPNIVALYDFLEIGGRPCIVMEYVDGVTIDQRIRQQGAIPPAEALELIRAATDGLDYLHARGIIHRDLKCSNIKLTSDGRIKLLDFGLAKSHHTPRFTQTGLVVGTLEYMAPEQLSMQPLDGRTDLWALGVILYEMVTGRLPFAARDPVELIGQVTRGRYFAASTLNPAVPTAVDKIIASCLEAEPKNRVASAAALRRMIESVQSGGRPARKDGSAESFVARVGAALRRPRTGLAVAGLLSAAAVVVLLATWVRPSPPPDPPPAPAPLPPAASAGPVAAAEPRAPGESGCGAAIGAVGREVREVSIRAMSGRAEVFCGGRRLGFTPFDLPVVIGQPVSVTLRQAGYRDTTIPFVPTASTTGFLIRMRATDGAAERSAPGETVPLLMAGWLPFFGRRRKNGQRGAVKETRLGAAVGKETGFGAAAGPGGATIAVEVLSDVGCVRDSNEDAIAYCHPTEAALLEQKGTLLVVADGMGGHSAGEVASRLAVETVVEQYGINNGDPQTALTRGVLTANQRIREAAASDDGRTGMGTTCTALVVRQGWAYCSHVGDSRLYLIRDGAILQMTEDDSAVFDLVRRGVIDRDAARHHPDRNVIVRALGSRPDVQVSEWSRPLFVRHGDRFLASTDGLHDLVSDDELCESVTSYDPETACRLLVGLARERGGHDNISIGILSIGGEPGPMTIPFAAGLPGERAPS